MSRTSPGQSSWFCASCVVGYDDAGDGDGDEGGSDRRRKKNQWTRWWGWKQSAIGDAMEAVVDGTDGTERRSGGGAKEATNTD